jgi:hypothetical protein
MRHAALVFLGLALAPAATAEIPVLPDDLVPPVQVGMTRPAPPPPPRPSPWSSTGKASAQLINVSTGNADTSLDPTIRSTTTSTTYVVSFEGSLMWRVEPHSIEQLLKARWGRSNSDHQGFSENTDELRYDGIYRHAIGKPHYLYVAWGAETVFTGPPPSDYRLDPVTAKASSGYGQIYEDVLPVTSRLDGRLGARAQKSWGEFLTPEQRHWESGAEAFLRYEQTPFQHDGNMARVYAQYEGFAEFNDLAHITNLITAGATLQMLRYVAVDVRLRLYYETRPKESGDPTPPGYNQWSVRQETLVGLTYIW